MLVSIIGLLVMLNPFALFLYLEPVRKDLDHKHFMRVIFKASMISLTICFFFFFSGEFLFKKIFMIDFESFRIFGGIIIFSYAYMYIVKGQKALIIIKENLDDLASEIALPFMVGAGTISLTIVTSYRHTRLVGILVLVAAFLINFLSIYLLKIFRDSLDRKKFKTAYDKNIEVLLRLNGFFIGAIGVNMVFVGIRNTFGI